MARKIGSSNDIYFFSKEIEIMIKIQEREIQSFTIFFFLLVMLESQSERKNFKFWMIKILLTYLLSLGKSFIFLSFFKLPCYFFLFLIR